ncbi:NUDIX hydrolase [Paenibacillus sp. L3-i20]|uniref:NUDIX hydrolase n=1 Tax=Paenibacillus sp. L3-i20 TaxID=2905833 RepID=UPI001EDEF836|nr:NUDIX domain-containing protein [Paenibacillus sp. L3-i20]GKU79149.1 hypothetical protein L3i20_v235460 [Paenibacillus sp. L3-i20]
MLQNGIVLVVSVSIMKDDKVLMIKEEKVVAHHKWNFPSGRIEIGEDIQAAASREVKEETGYDVKLTSTTGVYNFISSLGNHIILFHFIAQITGGTLMLEEGIIEGKWFTLSELLNLDETEFRDHQALKEIINNLSNEVFLPLQIYNVQLRV